MTRYFDWNILRLQGGGGGGGGGVGSYGFHPCFYPLHHCVIITVNIIGRHCLSRLDIVDLGIGEAQVESVLNGIGIIPNSLGP